MCEYFEISPADFFDEKHSNPELLTKAYNEMKNLSDEDILLLLTLVNRLKRTDVI